MVKAKKKQLSEFSQQKRKQQNKKRLNPFEIHINKDKQNVLGRKNKADKGLPGISRAKAIKKRKGTLLQEYKLKNKDNVFLDKRIGEKNVGMSNEDKAMARFTAERMKAHKKKNIFNLNDDEQLTHRGQTLEEIEKFDDPKSDDESSDDENKTGKLDKKFVSEAHFGGGVLSKQESGKSRKDLIDELIAESKKRKAEKQKIREQTIDLTEKLDSEWKDLLPIVSAANKSAQETLEAKADDYDIAVRKLKFEARGTPSEKLKSEEEIIKEEKEKLEALEADRLARMKGFINDSNNETKHKSADDLDDDFVLETVDEAEDEGNNLNKNTEEDTSGNEDDNDDDDDDDDNDEDNEDDDNANEDNIDEKCSEEEKDNNGEENDSDAEKNDSDDDAVSNVNENEIEDNEAKINTQVDCVKRNGTNKKSKEIKSHNNFSMENENGVDTESSSSEEDNLSDLKVSESSSEDDSVPCKKKVTFGSTSKERENLNHNESKSILKKENSENIEQSNENNRQHTIRNDLLKRKEIMEKARKELPYTYKAPESFEELEKLLQDRNAEYQSVIIDRIIKCNHWTLDGKNKEKLSNLFLYLLQHLNSCSVEDNLESVINCFQIVDRLSPFLYDLAHVNPENTKTFIQGVIKEKHDNFEKNKKRYPELDTLIFFKLVSLLFPTSDFRHPVVTPCIIFMSQILLRCRVKNRTDISKGLFVCTLILEYTVLSKRFSPAAINFLRGVIYTATPKHLIQGMKVIPPFKTVGEFSNLLILDEDQTNFSINPTAVFMKAADLFNDELDDEFKIRALITAVNLLNEFKNHLEELEAVYSIFEPIYKLLKSNTFEKYPKNVKRHIKEFQKSLKVLKNKKLEYIVREKKKPKPLRMYEPRIEKVYDGKKHKTTSKENAEREKLLHKYKKEMKGAIREIRRDRSFLAKIKVKEQIKSDAERKRKVNKIFSDAAVQQSEFKKMKRNK